MSKQMNQLAAVLMVLVIAAAGVAAWGWLGRGPEIIERTQTVTSTATVTASPTAGATTVTRTAPAITVTQTVTQSVTVAPAPPPPPKEATVRIGRVVAGVNSLPYLMPEDLGYFKAQGLKVEFTTLGAATLIATALVKGDLDVGITTLDNAMKVQIGGKDAIAFYKFNTWQQQIWATTDYMKKKGVTPYTPLKARLEAFRGGTFATFPAASSSEATLLWAIKAGGLDPEKDVKLVYMATGGVVAISEAILAGQVDGGVSVYVTNLYSAWTEGKVGVLIDFSQDFPETFLNLSNQVAFTTKEYADKNPDVLKRLVLAWRKGIETIYKDPKTTVELIGKYKLSAITPEQRALLAYKQALDFTSPTGELRVEDVPTWIKIMVNSGRFKADDFASIKPETFVTTKYLP